MLYSFVVGEMQCIGMYKAQEGFISLNSGIARGYIAGTRCERANSKRAANQTKNMPLGTLN
jgi:hypothetical protein